MATGFEDRNQNWEYPKCQYDAAKGCKTEADKRAFIAFFRVCKGMAHSFLWKDWADYNVLAGEGIMNLDGVGSGGPTAQLYKQYVTVVATEFRRITNPVSGSLILYSNAVALVAGVGAGNYSINLTTGLVTFVPTSSKVITGITQGANGQVTTSTAHGFLTGQKIYHSAIAGMTQLNGVIATITNVDATHYNLNINTTGYTAYSGGGTAAFYPQPGDALTWTGEFDVPARFGTDVLQLSDTDGVYFKAPVPVMEIRVA
jgi:uncharacterized protein (TIGR02217 family)